MARAGVGRTNAPGCAERYDPDHDTALQDALRAERHRRLAGTAAQPLYTALRPDSGDVVRVTHREHGDFKLPAVIGMPGAWRDPDFETKAADVIATWRAATATSEPAA
ncbi:hypothetical protein F7Q99_30395 [Streptomyces kaniharaensis]|uniref:Uncharacterized protein n=1 Tax=Streptomyces kaniharaensis TaxID=212423 RepID=A0A6N7KXI1_9ACTN|nr:hypothetical protein [Streptomyces kaniharaensis]MQS16396.1 hypothetical protein [Streptomyces kaniharaensis]